MNLILYADLVLLHRSSTNPLLHRRYNTESVGFDWIEFDTSRQISRHLNFLTSSVFEDKEAKAVPERVSQSFQMFPLCFLMFPNVAKCFPKFCTLFETFGKIWKHEET